MTPLAFANSLAHDLGVTPLPKPVHAQLGEIVVDCPGTTITILGLSEVDPTSGGTGNCDKIEMASITIVAARDCSFVANEDGTTDWPKQNAVSALLDLDSQVLYDMAEKWRANAWYRVPGFAPTFTFANGGGIASVSLTLQLPIP